MNGPLTSLSSWFADLTPQEQVRFLIDLAHELTIATRDFYNVGEDGFLNPVAARHMNEIQHRVTAQARNILEDADEGQHPPAYGMIESLSNHPELDAVIRSAAAYARRRLEQSTVLA